MDLQRFRDHPLVNEARGDAEMNGYMDDAGVSWMQSSEFKAIFKDYLKKYPQLSPEDVLRKAKSRYQAFYIQDQKSHYPEHNSPYPNEELSMGHGTKWSKILKSSAKHKKTESDIDEDAAAEADSLGFQTYYKLFRHRYASYSVKSGFRKAFRKYQKLGELTKDNFRMMGYHSSIF